jgi:hypothetical protein
MFEFIAFFFDPHLLILRCLHGIFVFDVQLVVEVVSFLESLAEVVQVLVGVVAGLHFLLC